MRDKCGLGRGEAGGGGYERVGVHICMHFGDSNVNQPVSRGSY